MGGFMGWFLVFAGVLAIFNAEKLPAIKRMLEEKFKDSVDAAKEGSKVAQAKIQQVKTDIENKKNAPAPEVEAEENSPEEIDEALKFMNNFVKENKTEKAKEETPSLEAVFAEVVAEKQSEVPETPEEDGPIDLENRY